MALPHAQPNEVIDLKLPDEGRASARTSTLLKSESLEIIRLVLPAGKQIPAHQVAGEITVQCLEGRVVLQAGDRTHNLEAGQLVGLTGGCPHAVQGVTDATVLVTILLRK